jgi:GT2 family glycosyltransferase
MLSSFFKYTGEHAILELVVVDDFSDGETRDWLDFIKSEKIKIIRNSSNKGFAYSVNVGVSVCGGDIICLLNSDLVFDRPWLGHMIEILTTKGLSAGVVGNIQLRIDNSSCDHAGMRFTTSGKIEHIKSVAESIDPCREVFSVTGACMVFRKNDFLSWGGMSESYFNGGEDVDFCMKSRMAAKKNYVSTRSVVWHHVGLSRGTKVGLLAETNSAKLFHRWRASFKSLIAAQWLCSERTLDHVDAEGTLSEEFLSLPISCSRVLAEFVIRREEYRWARLLRGASVVDFSVSKVFVSSSAFFGKAGGFGECTIYLKDFLFVHSFGLNIEVCDSGSNSTENFLDLFINNFQKIEKKFSSGERFYFSASNLILFSASLDSIKVGLRFYNVDPLSVRWKILNISFNGHFFPLSSINEAR